MGQEQDKIPSFRVFDYRIRPNKSTERKMLSDAFRHLSAFEPIENYRYIGFGSTTFSDFVLFHKSLNIKDMISIEKRIDYEARFEFNKPFSCIQTKYGDSNQILPELDWNKCTITWLDYDGVLNDSVLQDIAFVASKSVSGSVLLITVNATGIRQKRSQKNYALVEKDMLSRFQTQLDREIPSWVKGKDLQGEQMAKTCQKIIFEEIKIHLRNRNGMTPVGQHMMFKPIFNLVYSDNARMLTVGGLFYRFDEKETLAKCKIEQLDFMQEEDLYEIKVPVITPRERHFLNQHLPNGARDELRKLGLTEEEIENYSRSYRYSPSFAEVELS